MILGGMGPQASTELLRLMTTKSIRDYEARANDDFPAIDLFSVPVPDFIGVDSSTRSTVFEMLLQRLRSASESEYVGFGIACNTVHLLADELAASTQIPFVSMISATIRRAKDQGASTVGILASPTTIQTGLYQQAAERFGLETVLPQGCESEDIERAIRTVIAGDGLDMAKMQVETIAGRMLSEGADSVILGCTELPLLFDEPLKTRVYLSSLDALADELLRLYYEQGEFSLDLTNGASEQESTEITNTRS